MWFCNRNSIGYIYARAFLSQILEFIVLQPKGALFLPLQRLVQSWCVSGAKRGPGVNIAMKTQFHFTLSFFLSLSLHINIHIKPFSQWHSWRERRWRAKKGGGMYTRNNVFVKRT